MSFDPMLIAQGVLSQVRKQRIDKTAEVTAPIMDVNKRKQIVYCVALEPGVEDDHGDVIAPDDIDYTAHRFLRRSRIIKGEHKGHIQAEPVESFVAPCDMHYDSGMYGKQSVKKGSWVIGIQVHDPREWKKIKSGEYTGVSVGGFGLREELL